MKTILISVAILLVLVSCNSSKEKTVTGQNSAIELKGNLRISGAYALAPLMKVWAAKFTSLHPGLKIDVVENGTGAGIQDLASAKCNIAMASVDLTPKQEELGLWKVPVSREAVVPIINSQNPDLELILKKGITRKQLSGVFSGKSDLDWGSIAGNADKSPVNVYIRADQSGAATIWATYLDLQLKDLKGKGMPGDTGIITAMIKDKMGLAFCNAHFAYDKTTDAQLNGIRILPVDVNGNGVIDKKEENYDKVSKLHHAAYLGTFPSHLCRDLVLVCHGKPSDPNIVEFIKWILTDGQIISVQEGYCEIRDCDKDDIIKKLNTPGE